MTSKIEKAAGELAHLLASQAYEPIEAHYYLSRVIDWLWPELIKPFGVDQGPAVNCAIGTLSERLPDICSRCNTDLGNTIGGRLRDYCPNCGPDLSEADWKLQYWTKVNVFDCWRLHTHNFVSYRIFLLAYRRAIKCQRTYSA